MPLTDASLSTTTRTLLGPRCSVCKLIEQIPGTEWSVVLGWLERGETLSAIARAVTAEHGAKFATGRLAPDTLSRHLRGECAGASHR